MQPHANLIDSGAICEACGDWIGVIAGKPRCCSDECRRIKAAEEERLYGRRPVAVAVKRPPVPNAKPKQAPIPPVACPHCARRFYSDIDLGNHARMRHGQHAEGTSA